MSDINNMFFELIRVALGNAVCLSHTPTAKEWQILYEMAKKQSLVGICFAGVQHLQGQRQCPPEMLYLQWMGMAAKIQQRNEVVNKRCEELQHRLLTDGFRSCILKGQGVAAYYKHLSSLRQSGDIDIWVDGSRDEIIRMIRSKDIGAGSVDYKHWSVYFFEDTDVEVHFRPTLFYSPIIDRKLTNWVRRNADVQFSRPLDNGFSSPSINFNIVYLLIHIYRHIFNGGIGLRQLMDLYFVLKVSSSEDRMVAFREVGKFGMERFVADVMYVCEFVFGLSGEYMLCNPSYKNGKRLLDFIMIGGNFGKYDCCNISSGKERLSRSFFLVMHNLKFIDAYPSEVLWFPLWKIWHWHWRIKNGFITY